MTIDSYEIYGYSALAKQHRTHQATKHQKLMEYVREGAKENEVIHIPWPLSKEELRCLDLHYLTVKDNAVHLNIKALDSKQRNELTKAKKKKLVVPEDVFSDLPWDQ